MVAQAREGALEDLMSVVRAGFRNIGWHTSRRCCYPLLRSLGPAPKVQKELLRHASIQTIMKICGRSATAAKREVTL